MDLFFDEETVKGNLQNRESYQEMEMEMKMENDMKRDNLDEKAFEKTEMEKNGDFGGEVSFQESDMGEKNGEEEEKGEEDENFLGIEGNNCIIGGYNKDLPPVDDVCPICFDRFTIPCRSNCGHWFCASCILEFWMYRSSIKPCKCPLCWSMMVNLKPATSQLNQPTDDTTKVLKKVQQYNGLYVKGLQGILPKVVLLPLVMGRIFRVLIDPDGLRCVYYVTRLLGLLLAFLYERWEFEFVSTGGLGIRRTFDMAASVSVPILFVVGVVYRWILRHRARRLAMSMDNFATNSNSFGNQ